MHKIGFVGCGNMGRAMLSGVLSAGLCESGDIIVSARTQKTLDAVHEKFGVNVASNNGDAAKAEMVILAVKPQMYESVIAEVAPSLSSEAIVVSIAPGKTLSWLAEKTGAKKIVRLMPNTPAAIGCGMTSVAYGDGLDDADKTRVMAFVQSFGEGEVLSEHLFDAATAVAGCSPAYVYMFIEAMADAGVAEGIAQGIGISHGCGCRCGLGPYGARNGPASRRAERCCVLACRYDHRRPSRARGERHAFGGHREPFGNG